MDKENGKLATGACQRQKQCQYARVRGTAKLQWSLFLLDEGLKLPLHTFPMAFGSEVPKREQCLMQGERSVIYHTRLFRTPIVFLVI